MHAGTITVVKNITIIFTYAIWRSCLLPADLTVSRHASSDLFGFHGNIKQLLIKFQTLHYVIQIEPNVI